MLGCYVLVEHRSKEMCLPDVSLLCLLRPVAHSLVQCIIYFFMYNNNIMYMYMYMYMLHCLGTECRAGSLLRAVSPATHAHADSVEEGHKLVKTAIDAFGRIGR